MSIILSKHIPLKKISTAPGFISWLSNHQKSNVFICVKGKLSHISLYSHFQFDNKLIRSLHSLIPLLLALLQLPKSKHGHHVPPNCPAPLFFVLVFFFFFSVIFVYSQSNLLLSEIGSRKHIQHMIYSSVFNNNAWSTQGVLK